MEEFSSHNILDHIPQDVGSFRLRTKKVVSIQPLANRRRLLAQRVARGALSVESRKNAIKGGPGVPVKGERGSNPVEILFKLKEDGFLLLRTYYAVVPEPLGADAGVDAERADCLCWRERCRAVLFCLPDLLPD